MKINYIYSDGVFTCYFNNSYLQRCVDLRFKVTTTESIEILIFKHVKSCSLVRCFLYFNICTIAVNSLEDKNYNYKSESL
jgi:hypothetical protein